MGLPRYPHHLSNVPCPLSRRIETGASVGSFPVPRGLPRYCGGSASASTLSRPAQASLALRPAGLLNRPRRHLSRGFAPAGHPAKPLVSYQTKPTSVWTDPPSVGDTRRRGAPEKADAKYALSAVIASACKHVRLSPDKRRVLASDCLKKACHPTFSYFTSRSLPSKAVRREVNEPSHVFPMPQNTVTGGNGVSISTSVRTAPTRNHSPSGMWVTTLVL